MRSTPVRQWLAALASVFVLPLSPGHAQTETWRLHAALDGRQAPLLCADRDSVNLVGAVRALAAAARAGNDQNKAARLTALAGELESMICRRPVAEDVVILRCKVAPLDAAALSVVKVSALIRAEASKGEQPFFALTAARIDESGTGGAEAQEADRRWCGGEAVAEAVRLSPDIIAQVQRRLYDFGLRMTDASGQIGNDTVQGLTAFQKWANLSATGDLNKQTLDRITTTPAPSPWVAFAFDGYGNFGAETGATRREAEFEAVRRLQRRSRSDFKLSAVPSPSCIGFAVTRYVERGRRSRTTFTQAFTSAGDSHETASRNAFDYCEREKNGGRCDVRYALCADGGRGQARRFDPGTLPVNAPAPRFDPKIMPLNASDPSAPKRFDPKDTPNNTPRFDPKDPPDNAQRFDPSSIPANAPRPR